MSANLKLQPGSHCQNIRQGGGDTFSDLSGDRVRSSLPRDSHALRSVSGFRVAIVLIVHSSGLSG